jgi:RNA polymerase sigma factor (sigma-70 family)
MPRLAELLDKARRAVIRHGVAGQDADELVHDAFVKVEQYQRIHSVRVPEALLVKAAVNLSIDRHRRNARAPFVDVEHLHNIADATPDPAELAEQRARLQHVARGIDRLPARTRRILLKRRMEDMSYADIAESEEMSVAAVEKHVARATLQLMKWMDGW